MVESNSQSASTASANAGRIAKELDSLAARLEARPVHFKDFWAHVQELNSLFRELRPLGKNEREPLWRRFGAACTRAKELQEEFRRQSERRQSSSRNKRSLVEGKIHDALGWAKAGRTPSDLAKARELLNEASAWMKNGWTGFNIPTQLFAFDDGKMTQSDHDACWEKWREASDALRSRREDLGKSNFGRFHGEVEDAIGTAEYDPKRAKEMVVSIQAAMRGMIMSSDQFAEIRRLLDKAWNHASRKQGERHDAWVGKQQSFVDHKRELIEQQEEVIEQIEGEVDHCRDLLARARTAEFEDSVRDSIERKMQVIAKKRTFIRELEEQIREIEAKLRR